MEKPPQFIRKFSKKESREERKRVARAIRFERKYYFEKKRDQRERQSELEKAIAENLEAIRSLEDEITELSASGLKRILNYFKLRRRRSDMALAQADMALAQKMHDKLKEQQQDTEAAEEIPQELQKARAWLTNFYERQKEKWAESEYTEEDIRRNFSEEHLASLSLEEYILLLKRFPGEMVTHVTRQGVRDHSGHMYHTRGVGAYADGFMKMVEDGRLRSPLGVHLVEWEKEQAIAKFLQLDRFKTKEGALEYLDTIAGGRQGDPGSYVDRMAIHFATEEVADCYYGSEKGNEIFIAYPSAYIASQYYFNGQLNEGGGGYWNDLWVWANEEKGMDLNAGIIFIPEEARVDRKTGSRYELDRSGNPIKNAEYQAAFRQVVDSPDFHEFAKQVMEITGELDKGKGLDTPDLQQGNRELLEKLEPFRQRLEREFGITDRRLQMAILDYQHLFNLTLRKENQEKERESSFHSIDSDIEYALKNYGILYVEAKDTISSKEFWEARFAENPSKRPSKVVYYKGSSPTRALHEWRDAQGICKKAKDEHIGFPQRHVLRNDPQATAGRARFRILAEKVIEDYFSNTTSN